MTHTENYNLNMPDDDDFFDAEHMNENMETIDTAMHDMEVKTADFEDKIGSSSDTGTTTIMGKLNKYLSNWQKKIVITFLTQQTHLFLRILLRRRI